ncbi:hypothetical protein [Streptomyces luteireticuli]|uniref:MarR family transcriptional regulator n=1 Tax=Streptomyces luteireticuli TaxID=173858 RepID=A0ABN0YZD8_9ACTN
MRKHAIAPACAFTQVPNEIIRHPRLGAPAVRLLSWVLSMPDEASEALSETARRAGLKKSAFQKAKSELLTEGFLHEWKRPGERGRWKTEQLISNRPLTPEEAVAVRDGRPSVQSPAVGRPKGRAVGRLPSGNTVENTPSLPSPEAQEAEPTAEETGEGGKLSPTDTTATEAVVPEADAGAGAVPESFVRRGALALAAVSHGEQRLRLSGRDVAALAPLAGEWLQRGASVEDLREALTQWLPERVHSCVGLVRDRLIRKMPSTPTAAERRAARESTGGPRVAQMVLCEGSGHGQEFLFPPVGNERLCPGCRSDRAADEAQGWELTRVRYAAGAAAARALIVGGAA